MTGGEIQHFCIKGTEAYLQFLVRNDRGLEEIPVTHVESVTRGEKPVFKLILQRRLFDPDSVFIKLTPPNRDFGSNDFAVVEYDADTKVLIVEIRNGELDLGHRPANHVSVVSDLRFLVKNVESWFERNGGQLSLPEQALPNRVTSAATTHVKQGLPLETCQGDAIQKSLTNPLTYVWGPPGAGKTKHVLAGAVIQLLLSGKKVGVYAPTNNALEQAMAAVLRIAAGFGINRDKFLRVGYPSAKFANEFPEVCEIQGLGGRIKELNRQIANYTAVLHCRRGPVVLNSAATVHHEIGELRKMQDQRREICGVLGGGLIQRVVSILKGQRQALEKKLTDLEARIQGQLEIIRRTTTESPQLNKIFGQASFTNIEETERDVARIESEITGFLERKVAIAKEHETKSDEEIKRLVADLELQKQTLEAQTIVERIKAASVIGMTLDCHIGRFFNQFIQFDHIFLDEAGYAPAVKSLTLCRGGVPLTFIGDHKQLGPVCEMNDENLGLSENNSALVWKKSALFIDDLFIADSGATLINEWQKIQEPQLRRFTKTQLNKTFRFGQNLADILSECVYDGMNFISAAPHEEVK